MQAVNATLVITNPNTSDMKVFFNGYEVLGIEDLKIDWDKKTPRVTMTLSETDLVQEMKANNINVRRAV